MNAWVTDSLPAIEWLAAVVENVENASAFPEGTYFGSWAAAYGENKTVGWIFASFANETSYNHVNLYVPKGVDASKEIEAVATATYDLWEGINNVLDDPNNITAYDQYAYGFNNITISTLKTLFDSFSVTVAKGKSKASSKSLPDFETVSNQYYAIFDLVMTYTFIAGGLALILITALGVLSLPKHERRLSIYIRSGICAAFGVALCCLSAIRYNDGQMIVWLGSAWMIPTICLVLFVCVIITHVRLDKKKTH